MDPVAKPITTASAPSRRVLFAYVGPFAFFLAFIGLAGGLKISPGPEIPLWRTAPELWVYPIQTVSCGALLFYFRREYPKAQLPTSVAIFGVVVGMIVFAVWISPQALFHVSPRNDGFNPTLLLGAGSDATGSGAVYWPVVTLRFIRLVAVVPVLEELFWRAFLLRYLMKEDFLSLPFGSWSWISSAAVTLGFTFEHQGPDRPAALIAGVLYNVVAIRTRSFPACVAAHAVTNALLGGYVMYTRQWGFW